MDKKGSSLPLAVFGIVLIIIALAVAFSNVGMTREQINEGQGFDVILGDYFIRIIIAIILLVIGIVLVILGARS